MDLTPEIYHEADIPFDMDLISGPVIPKNMNNKAIVNCTSNFTYFPLYVEDVSIQSNFCYATSSQIWLVYTPENLIMLTLWSIF